MTDTVRPAQPKPSQSISLSLAVQHGMLRNLKPAGRSLLYSFARPVGRISVDKGSRGILIALRTCEVNSRPSTRWCNSFWSLLAASAVVLRHGQTVVRKNSIRRPSDRAVGTYLFGSSNDQSWLSKG
jgi:hypothetical protein